MTVNTEHSARTIFVFHEGSLANQFMLMLRPIKRLMEIFDVYRNTDLVFQSSSPHDVVSRHVVRNLTFFNLMNRKMSSKKQFPSHYFWFPAFPPTHQVTARWISLRQDSIYFSTFLSTNCLFFLLGFHLPSSSRAEMWLLLRFSSCACQCEASWPNQISLTSSSSMFHTCLSSWQVDLNELFLSILNCIGQFWLSPNAARSTGYSSLIVHFLYISVLLMWLFRAKL